MIKFEGFYIEEPVKIIDERARSNKENYGFSSYEFVANNSVFLRTLYYTTFQELKSIKFKDLLTDKSSRLNWTENNSNIIIRDDSPFTKDYLIRVKSENELYNE